MLSTNLKLTAEKLMTHLTMCGGISTVFLARFGFSAEPRKHFLIARNDVS
jgi:hypothetical protein